MYRLFHIFNLILSKDWWVRLVEAIRLSHSFNCKLNRFMFSFETCMIPTCTYCQAPFAYSTHSTWPDPCKFSSPISCYILETKMALDETQGPNAFSFSPLEQYPHHRFKLVLSSPIHQKCFDCLDGWLEDSNPWRVKHAHEKFLKKKSDVGSLSMSVSWPLMKQLGYCHFPKVDIIEQP